MFTDVICFVTASVAIKKNKKNLGKIAISASVNCTLPGKLHHLLGVYIYINPRGRQ